MNNSIIFIIITFALVLISFILDRQKTIKGLKKGLMMFKNIAVPFLNVLILISILLYIIPASLIVTTLGASSGIVGFFLAAFVGAITLIPGFISYPIAATLLSQGASYATVTVFMTTLMMVGFVTLPIEIKYFGREVALVRNLVNFIAAMLIGLLVSLVL